MRAGHQLETLVSRTLGIARVSRKRTVDRFEAIRSCVGADVQHIFDIGANRGQSLRRFRTRFPAAEIYAFEPHPEIFKELRSKFSDLEKVEVFPLAMADRPGSMSFNLNRMDMNHSLLSQAEDSQKWASIDHIATIDVDCSTVDLFCAERKIERVDLLKIDAEGADLQVLEGAEGMIGNRRIGCIYVELLYVEIFSGQPFYFDVARFLFDHGYSLFDFYQNRFDSDGRLISSNGLFFSEA